MSTDLFRKYINIINEVSENEMTELTRAITDLETVLSKYKNKIRESLSNRTRLGEAPRTPEQQAAMDALRGLNSPASSGSTSSGGGRSTVTPAELDALRYGPKLDNRTRPAGFAFNEPADPELFSSNRRSQSTVAKPSVATTGAVSPGIGSKIKSGLGKVGKYAGYAALGYEIISRLYNYLMKTDLKDLAPGDQEIIKKNMPIIQSWLAPEKFTILDRYPDLQLRLLHVVDLLGKLGMSMQSQPAAATPAQTSTPATDKQSLEALLKKAQFNEHYQSELKKIVLENMHLFSESEKIAIHRTLLSEDWTDWATWLAPHKGSVSAGALKAAGAGTLAWAQKQADQQAEEKAAAAAAEAQARAAYDAEVAARPTLLGPDGKPIPPKPFEPPPTAPSKLGPVRRTAAKIAPTNLAKSAMKKPGKAGLLAMTGYGVYNALEWMYDVVSPVVSKTVGAKAGLDSIESGLRAMSKTSPKDDYLELFKYLTDHPDEYAKADAATKKMIDQKQLDYCNNFPREPGCAERKQEICKDYGNNLPGCNL